MLIFAGVDVFLSFSSFVLSEKIYKFTNPSWTFEVVEMFLQRKSLNSSTPYPYVCLIKRKGFSVHSVNLFVDSFGDDPSATGPMSRCECTCSSEKMETRFKQIPRIDGFSKGD